MAKLLTDEQGVPVPQYLNPATGLYEAQYGTQGALNLNMQQFLQALVLMVKVSEEPDETGTATVTTFAPVGSTSYTSAQIYIESTNDIIGASIVAPMALGLRQVAPVLLRKQPSGSEDTKSMSILATPHANAALPSAWFLKVATSNDAEVPCDVIAGFQFVR